MGDAKSYQDILDGVSESQWKALSRKKVYFGHQSVGFNIAAGIEDIMAENKNLSWNIAETEGPGKMDGPGFYHSRIGKNLDWQLKIDDFDRKMRAGIGKKADIAFFKFCYVDITGDTDVEKIFASYRQTMQKLQQEFPETTFFHVTTPIRIVKTSWKTRIKQLIGKDEIWEFTDNIRRHEFNELIRREYGESGRLFDIAMAESPRPDGSRETFEKDGKRYEAMVPAFTDDGGHLNELGRKFVAARLLKLLADISG